MTSFSKEKLQNKINMKTKPLGALGKLEQVAFKIGAIQQTLSPTLIQPTLLVYASDHGIADEGVSAYPKEVTAQMVYNFLNGGAAVNVLSKANGLDLLIIDMGVDADFEPHPMLLDAKIRKGTSNMLVTPAFTTEEAEQAIQKSKEIVHQLTWIST